MKVHTTISFAKTRILRIRTPPRRDGREGTDAPSPIRIDAHIVRRQHNRQLNALTKMAGDIRTGYEHATGYHASFGKLIEALQRGTDTGEAPTAMADKKPL